MAPQRILFIGATGYIGRATVARLLEHPQRANFEITVLLRSESNTKLLEDLGFKVAIGSLQDSEIVEHLAYESDIIFQSADSDDVSATRVLLKGMKRHYEKTNNTPIYIHTTGTGSLVDHAEGKFAGENIYSDLEADRIESLPATNPHRDVDVIVVEADSQGYVKAFIVAPSCVWGFSNNILEEKGLRNRSLALLPYTIGLGVRRGVPVACGPGLNIWSVVHIDEAAQLYYLLFDAIISSRNPAHGRDGYYFLENGESRLLDVYSAIGKSLFEHGKIQTAEPTDLKEEEKSLYFMSPLIAGNSRARGDRSRSLGWKPVKGAKDFIGSIELEVEFWLQNNPVL